MLRTLDLLLPGVCAACEQPLAPDGSPHSEAPPRGWCAACVAGLPGLRVPRCPRCGERRAAQAVPAALTPPGSALDCPQCRRAPPPLDHCLALADYARPLDSLVLAIKFGRQSALAAPLGRLLAEACRAGWPPSWPAPDAVVPIPLAPRRLAERGFNQALLLAAPVAAAFGQTVRRGLLLRKRETLAASLLDAKGRRQALDGAFHATAAARNARIIVVDDVMTTGATLRAAALALKAAGAARVVACVACRTAPGSRYDLKPAPPDAIEPEC